MTSQSTKRVRKQWQVAKAVNSFLELSNKAYSVFAIPILLTMLWHVVEIKKNGAITIYKVERNTTVNDTQNKHLIAIDRRVFALETNRPKWPPSTLERPNKALKPAGPRIER